jgi:hypothetical protein
MKPSLKISKDNLLMSTLVLAGLVMATLGPALDGQDTQAMMNSAGRLVQSVPTPSALEPVMYREAAIIATAPRLQQGA